ncbi:MAG TPA: helix-turn-helix domain-containing protein [Stellaceae bacterium]|nr:helix-turn-helix domain-containing protein [Stellaceae bacterium]
MHLVRPCNICVARDWSACAPLDGAEQKRLVDHRVRRAPGDLRRRRAGRARLQCHRRRGENYKLLQDGRRQITGFLFAGDFLGLTYNEAYADSAEALVPSKLCCFPRRKLEALLGQIPKLEQRLLGMASHEPASAQDQIMLLGRKSARERVVSFLLMLSAAAIRHGGRAEPVFLPMSRGDIADYLGLTIETVSRTLTQLKAQGLVELLDEKHIRLSRPDALAEIAGGY